MKTADFVEHAANAAEIFGVVIIAGGLLVATVRYASTVKSEPIAGYARYRHDLGRAILLGLEVLVAADIVRTVAFTPTMDSVAILAMIVAIRTFLSWSLALELDGRWPWQRGRESAESTPLVAPDARAPSPPAVS
jgi:uncharacterized membrane protein